MNEPMEFHRVKASEIRVNDALDDIMSEIESDDPRGDDISHGSARIRHILELMAQRLLTDAAQELNLNYPMGGNPGITRGELVRRIQDL